MLNPNGKIHRNGAGCSNNRIVSDELYESRALYGLTETLLDPDAADVFVREYHSEVARRDREEVNERPSLRSSMDRWID